MDVARSLWILLTLCLCTTTTCSILKSRDKYLEENKPENETDPIRCPPPCIYKLLGLEIVDAGDWFLFDACICFQMMLQQVPSHLPTSIQALNLEHNPIRVIKNESFKGLIDLLVLDLENTDISTIEKNAFEGLTNLWILELGHNSLLSIDVLEESVFGIVPTFLPSLKVLRIGGSKFSLRPGSMETMKYFSPLKRLDLSSSSNKDICHLPDDAFEGLKLSIFSFDYCECETFNPKAFNFLSIKCNDGWQPSSWNTGFCFSRGYGIFPTFPREVDTQGE